MPVETAPPINISSENTPTYIDLARDPSIDPLIRAHAQRLAAEASGDILVHEETDMDTTESEDEKKVPKLSEELQAIADKSIEFHERYQTLKDRELSLKIDKDSKVNELRTEIASKNLSDKQRDREFYKGYMEIRDGIVDAGSEVYDVLRESKAHYNSNQESYVELAIAEATADGAYILIEGQSNLAELVKNGVEIIPGMSPAELTQLEETGRSTGFNYIGIITQAIKLLGESASAENIEQIISNQLRIAQSRKEIQNFIINQARIFEGEINMATFPELNKWADSLGLSEDQKNLLYSSWASYDKDRRAMDPNNPDDIVKYAKSKSEILLNGIWSVDDYIEKYGKEEFDQIMDIFGISNFTRYTHELIHNQLEAWNNGEVIPENLIISAQDDWNGAFGDLDSLISQIGTKGTFFFEASNGLGMAKKIVSVGNRERKNGRNPEEAGSIRNLIIAAHGSPGAILLGSGRQMLQASDYQNPNKKTSSRINDYRKHLGKNCRVVLVSCSTAGDNNGNENIASAIADNHDMKVNANVADGGAVKIDPNGEVIFWADSINNELKAAILDGTEGNGVDASYPFKTRLARWKRLIKKAK